MRCWRMKTVMTVVSSQIMPQAMPTFRDSDGKRHPAVVRVEHCKCAAQSFDWPLAEIDRRAIDSHWQRQSAQNPGYFDGIVLLTSSYRLAADGGGRWVALEMRLFETRFRNYLFWRHQGHLGGDVLDGFGSAVIRSRDGAVLLVRQTDGNVNSGLYYFPSGFIDRRDIDGRGYVDIAASVTREVAEETGLGVQDLAVRPGFVVTRAGPHLAVGVEYVSALDSEILDRKVRAFLSRDTAPEIAELRWVRQTADLEGLNLAPHCAMLLPWLLRAVET